jgi:glycosyltransferase involved in cell wall biosynthesis
MSIIKINEKEFDMTSPNRMSDRPKLSVIIPAYKFAQNIQQCIYSVLWQQTDFPFEVLVRDDFSQDGTAELIERMSVYYKNLRYFRATENWGGHKNVEFLYNQTRGIYVSYIDGDDFFTDEKKLQKQVDFLDVNPEYVGHCTSYWRYEDYHAKMFPENVRDFMTSWKLDIELKDLFDENYITFGRTFRKIPNLFKSWMKEVPFADYAINFELCKHGKFKCSEFPPGGVYRDNKKGALTGLSPENKKKLHEETKRIIIENYNKEKMKTLTIVDSFIHNESVENKLSNFLDLLNVNNHEVLLISNTTIPEYIQKKAKYCIYNNNNTLFNDEYDNVSSIVLWKHMKGFRINEVTDGLQRHGLSVMINIFDSLNLAKSLGYDYFQRFEIDAIHGPEAMNFVNNIPLMLQENDKEGLFYVNHYADSSDFSFHYFFCNIDLFLKNVRTVKSEKDYQDYLYEKFNSKKFMNVEEYIYDNFEKGGFEGIMIKPSSEQRIDFPDTLWNTETSMSNIDEKYRGTTTKFYKIRRESDGVFEDTGEYLVLTYNYVTEEKNRYIKLFAGYNVVQEITQSVSGKGSWTYNPVNNNVTHMEIYENDELLFTEDIDNSYSNIEFD